MEASLLPSREIREFCGKVVMACVRRGEPSLGLEKEFQIPTGAPLFVVLDPKGETLAKIAAGDIGTGCTPQTVAQYPRLVAERLESILNRTETLEALERSWAAAGEALAARLEEQKDYRRLADLCETLAPASKNPEAWLLKALQRRAQTAFPPSVDKYRKVCELAGRILSEHPSTPEAASAMALFWRGCGHGFDVPSRSARAIEELEKRGDGAAFRSRIDELKALRSETIRKMEAARDKQPKVSDWYQAWLGDAEAGIRFYSRPVGGGQTAGGALSGGFNPAEYQAYTAAMLEEARAKQSQK